MATRRDEGARKYVGKISEIAAKYTPDNTDREVQRCPSCHYMTYDGGVGQVTCEHCGIVYDRCAHEIGDDGTCAKCTSPRAAFLSHRHNRGLADARRHHNH